MAKNKAIVFVLGMSMGTGKGKPKGSPVLFPFALAFACIADLATELIV